MPAGSNNKTHNPPVALSLESVDYIPTESARALPDRFALGPARPIPPPPKSEPTCSAPYPSRHIRSDLPPSCKPLSLKTRASGYVVPALGGQAHSRVSDVRPAEAGTTYVNPRRTVLYCLESRLCYLLLGLCNRLKKSPGNIFKSGTSIIPNSALPWT